MSLSIYSEAVKCWFHHFLAKSRYMVPSNRPWAIESCSRKCQQAPRLPNFHIGQSWLRNCWSLTEPVVVLTARTSSGKGYVCIGDGFIGAGRAVGRRVAKIDCRIRHGIDWTARSLSRLHWLLVPKTNSRSLPEGRYGEQREHPQQKKYSFQNRTLTCTNCTLRVTVVAAVTIKPIVVGTVIPPG